ncbi:hypothetical protein KUV62_13975 [Salipiger bermudensis]|uniref:hypothetical protein n=1 Tax=Salipiger bermudensis TaxID=344736 RepID=UPI001C993578|nr:hypothetical protein [Salipiger bermudensis]MBY6005025.1 hypothetical protein [Salipiger bermudensis]
MIRIAAVFFLLLGISACTEALVYGERTGVNLAIRSDPAEAAPLEVNAGLQRRVVAHVPPSQRDANGRPTGEGVNMFSRFDLQREAGQNAFGGNVRIGTSFASGRAATAIAGKPKVVAAVTHAPVFTAVTVPAEVDVSAKLLDYTAANPTNLETYLNLALQHGLSIALGDTSMTRAIGTIVAPENAGGNKRIAEFLKL